MAELPFEDTDWRLLRCFCVVAEEGSLRAAAQRLCITEPPLSRQIKRLEDMLGVRLFERHNRGLSLTEDGRRALGIVQPVLDAQKNASARLRVLRNEPGGELALGLTTAFEQGVFERVTHRLREQAGRRLRLVRGTSPDLARMVRKGTLDAALAALPLDAPGLAVWPLPHEEPLFAVLPSGWPESRKAEADLKDLSGRPLFWFRREASPAFYDHAKGVFALAGFAPDFLEEPAEYDVLLAAIAQGEGMALLPQSFTATGRKNVTFLPLAKNAPLHLRLGLLMREAQPESKNAEAMHTALVACIASAFAEMQK